ncbi:MAG TPA: GNAT family N-acetyltransferase [Methyloceanibacter sp.]|nr:GNAT family N-acetyltransferase [Methyloceanibacter sp.]
MTAGALRIRNPRPADESAWRELWAGYLAFYEAEICEEVTAATWRRLVQPGSGMFGRVAVWQGTITGFTVCVLHPGSWTLSPACYLEDLFVVPGVRGQGIGRALIEDLLHTARKRRWSPVYWHTRQSNKAARKLYDKFAEADDFVRYRIFLPAEKRKRRRTAAGASRRV